MIRGLLIFAVILLTLNAGYVFVSPVVKNAMLEGRMEDVAKNRGMKGKAAIRRDLMEFIQEKKLPIAAEQLRIEKVGDEMTVAARYTVEATMWKYTRVYHFNPASHESARLAASAR